MENKYLPFFFFTTGLAGLGVSFVLISSKKFLKQNFYLSLCVLSLSIGAIYNFFYMWGIILEYPFLFILSKSMNYLVAPTAFLYIRNIFHPINTYRKFDVINFIPFLLFITVLANNSLLDPSTMKKALTDSSLYWYISVKNTNLYEAICIAKTILWLLYCLLQSLYIIKFEKKRQLISINYNYRLMNWIKVFNITLIFLFSSLFIQRITNFSFISLDFVSDTIMSVMLLITLGFLVCNPHILYSLEHQGLIFSADDSSFANQQGKEIRAASHFPINKQLFNSKKRDEYLLILDDTMKEMKPYLNKGITVRDLSVQTGIPAHHLSNLISNEFKLHFQDFINQKRIEHLKLHIDDPCWKQFTMEGICWEIGFTSRTTFFRAFVKFTGRSPSEYFNSLKHKKYGG